MRPIGTRNMFSTCRGLYQVGLSRTTSRPLTRTLPPFSISGFPLTTRLHNQPQISVLVAHSRFYHPQSQQKPPAGYYRYKRRLPTNTIIKFVPQQESWIVERFGKFSRILDPGLAILVPFVEKIAYVHSLKEVAVEVPSQTAITADNVSLELDGVLYYRVVDPYKASYGVEDSDYAITQLAQTTMRSEIGQLTLDRTLAERSELNKHIVEAINSASDSWGIKCMRYEVRDIHLPKTVIQSMHSQVSAERSKRAAILQSEGTRQAEINIAEGKKQSVVLNSEAEKQERINKAKGEAEAILLKATATATSIREIATAISNGANNTGKGGAEAVALNVAEKWVDSWSNISKQTNTIVIPASISDPASMITQALSVYKSVSTSPSFNSTSTSSSAPSSPTSTSPEGTVLPSGNLGDSVSFGGTDIGKSGDFKPTGQ
ncbi:hypothetical protein BKA69DRAFT_1089996 [Paraphysoderma sedebokerense]|nr:hypothetical protein BKA69DRAFT_1089996 [Paraphysoderma sedebokerense]